MKQILKIICILTASSASGGEAVDTEGEADKTIFTASLKRNRGKGLTSIDADDAVNSLLRIKVIEHRNR